MAQSGSGLRNTVDSLMRDFRYGIRTLARTPGFSIIAETSTLLEDPTAYAAMSAGASPYGDGMAASRIAELTRCFLFGLKMKVEVVGNDQSLLAAA